MVNAISLTGEQQIHDSETQRLSQNPQEARRIPRRDYINRINYANFENIPLIVFFRHKRFGRSFSLKGQPLPCMENKLELTWIKGFPVEEDPGQFVCEKILIPDTGNYIAFSCEEYSISCDGLSLSLPEEAYTLANRKHFREEANGISATLVQNGVLYKGCLKNFNPEGFLIKLDREGNGNFKWLNGQESLSVFLGQEGNMIFSGECRISSIRENTRYKECITVPLADSVKRFSKKKYRGERYELSSSLNISFNHPISGRQKHLRIKDISGSGFSLTEPVQEAVLFAGLILPEVSILLPGDRALRCRVQVIYRSFEDEENPEVVKCGLAILDMDPREHSLLLNYIHQEIDNRAYVCNDVDMTALWSFFFESGFIYPEKYRHIQGNKENLKSLYEKLYTQHPGIARHFIYQEGARIQGHLSMLRSYENSWLLHHHAASTSHSQNAGLHVLNQIGSFGNNCHKIESLHLNYLMCYFRRDNKFPNKVFGGLAEKIGNPKSCSLDDWAYYHIRKEKTELSHKDAGWQLEKTSPGELRDLDCLYENISGGLMLRAFNLEGEDTERRSLFDEYEDSGFSRQIELFSLKKEGRTSAVIMVDRSEAGLNMSDLTNSFKVFLSDPEDLSREVLESVLQELSSYFTVENRIPVLLYPFREGQEMNLPIEKKYTLWVINMEASDTYFHYLKMLLRIIRH